MAQTRASVATWIRGPSVGSSGGEDGLCLPLGLSSATRITVWVIPSLVPREGDTIITNEMLRIYNASSCLTGLILTWNPWSTKLYVYLVCSEMRQLGRCCWLDTASLCLILWDFLCTYLQSLHNPSSPSSGPGWWYHQTKRHQAQLPWEETILLPAAKLLWLWKVR